VKLSYLMSGFFSNTGIERIGRLESGPFINVEILLVTLILAY
jgi:hypothetical protein